MVAADAAGGIAQADAAANLLTHQPANLIAAGDAASGVALADAAASVLQTHQPADTGDVAGDAAGDAAGGVALADAAVILSPHQPADIVVEIGRAHVCTPVTNAQHVCRLLL